MINPSTFFSSNIFLSLGAVKIFFPSKYCTIWYILPWLHHYRSLNNQTACHRAIVLLTDASLDQTILDAVATAKQQQPYSVDIYTLTIGIRADDTYAGQLSCDNGGDSYVITTNSDLEEAISGYYQ